MKFIQSSDPKAKVLPLGGILCLAALGQYFLIQQDKPWTILPGFLLFAIAVLFLSRNQQPGPPSFLLVPLPLWAEALTLTLIFILALFLRLYRLNQFPAGIFADEACEGWGALKILEDGWSPFPVMETLSVRNPSIYYFLALWFKFIPHSQITLFGASVFLSLVAFPLLYSAFRQLTGQLTALTALFFIAIMRWHITYSRDAHPAIEILIYISGSLALWLYAHRSGKSWAFFLGGLVCGLGLYSYQAYKPFPILMAIFAIYEWFHPSSPKKFRWQYFLFFLAALIVSIPVWGNMLRNHSLGTRESQLMAFPGIYEKNGVVGVMNQLLGTLLAFNRTGDSWYIHNLPYHRLLDDGTGLFFLLGLGITLFRIRNRPSFYALAGFCVMCLPAFLSTYPNHASRLFGTIPFIALLSAMVLEPIIGTFLTLAPSWKSWAIKGSLMIFFLILILQNYWVYFEIQAKNNDCWRADNGAEASWIGNSISSLQKDYSFLVCSRFYGNYTLEFLAFNHRDTIYPLNLPTSLDLTSLSREKGVCVVLEEGHQGVLHLFQTLYPTGSTQIFRDLNGNPIAYLYLLKRGQVTQGPGPKSLPLDYGLKGNYQNAPGTNGVQTVTEIDPILNFTFRNDFPIRRFPPLWASWKGKLEAPYTGTYNFVILTSDKGTLILDGRRRLDSDQVNSGSLLLGKGSHEIQVDFQKISGTGTALTLLWKKPGDSQYTVIPPTAFRH